MKPTSDERIEIAERLRGPFDVCECAGHTFMNGCKTIVETVEEVEVDE